MSENKNINTEVVEQTNIDNNLTAREVWEQIVNLQDQLIDIKSLSHALCDIHVTKIEYNDDGSLRTEYDSDATRDKIKTLHSMQLSRETTLQKMLDCYHEIFRTLNCKPEDAIKLIKG